MLWLILTAALAATPEMKTVAIDYAQAPEAKAEDLGITAVGRTGGMAILAPSSDGDGISAYMCYYDHAYIRDPFEVCEVDLDTKKVSWYNSGAKTGLWGWMLGKDERFYTYANNIVWRFDPKTTKFERFGPTSPDGSNYSTWWADDGKLYIGTYPNSRVVRFDPETGLFHDYGPMGPERKHPAYAYRIAGDADHIYIGRGKIPWYLVALDKKTGEQTVLREVAQEGMVSFAVRDGRCYAVIDPTAHTAAAHKQEFFLLDGKTMTPVDALPEEKPDPRSPRRGIAARDGWEVCRWSGYAMPGGMSELWFRRDGKEWQSVEYRCGGTPARIFALTALSDGRIAGSTDDPYSIWVFDPKTDKTTILGKAPSHTYDLLWLDGKLYMSGYANAPVDVYDPAKPWTARAQTPEGFPPPIASPAANPHRVAEFNRAPFLQKWSPTMAVGADGRIYVACRADREKTGGCLGWYDPKSGKSDGLLEPFQTQGISQVVAVNDGKTILCSSYFAEDPNDPKAGDHQAHVMAYDVAQGKLVGDVAPVDKTRQWQTSALVEWQPGKVVGVIADPAGKGNIFYLLDVATMQVTSRVLATGDPAARLPVKMADGTLIGLQGTNVYQLDPATWTFTPVARLKLDKPPRRVRALGNHLYLSVEDHLMRVELK